MKSLLLFLILLNLPAHAAEPQNVLSIPLGEYTDETVACDNASIADSNRYYGDGLGFGHTGLCSFAEIKSAGNVYTIRMSCADNLNPKPEVVIAVFTVLGSNRVKFDIDSDSKILRWCAPNY